MEKHYINGILWYACDYFKGNLHGKWKGYFDNGTLSSVGSYNNGDRVGYWEWYNMSGGLTHKRYYII